MIVAVWRYRVKAEHRTAFEEGYGPGGDWARLFALGAGYLGTDLLRGAHDEYVTLDRWRDEDSWLRFKREFGKDYARLDAACAAWTLEEQPLGTFTPIDGGGTWSTGTKA